MTNTSLSLSNFIDNFKFYGFHSHELSKGALINPAFYIDLSAREFKIANNGGTNFSLSELSFYGFDYGSTSYVSFYNNLSNFEFDFVSNPKMAYTYTFPVYASLYDYQQANPSVTAPVPGLYDPTKSTEDVTFDTDGNFSLEFDNLEESIAQLNQKVDAATEADIALDNQLKQELMDYIDSLIQGSVEPEPPVDPDKPIDPDKPVDPAPPADPDSPNLDELKLPSVIIRKFPFCVPFDLINCVKVFDVPEKEPIWELPFVIESLNIRESVVLDLTKYESLVLLVKTMVFLFYVLFLVLVTRKLIKG